MITKQSDSGLIPTQVVHTYFIKLHKYETAQDTTVRGTQLNTNIIENNEKPHIIHIVAIIDCIKNRGLF